MLSKFFEIIWKNKVYLLQWLWGLVAEQYRNDRSQKVKNGERGDASKNDIS